MLEAFERYQNVYSETPKYAKVEVRNDDQSRKNVYIKRSKILE